jgi:hypothetical protein
MRLKEIAKCSAKVCAFSTFLLARISCDVLSGEVFLARFSFLVAFHSGFFSCKTLQEYLEKVIFVVIEE